MFDAEKAMHTALGIQTSTQRVYSTDTPLVTLSLYKVRVAGTAHKRWACSVGF